MSLVYSPHLHHLFNSSLQPPAAVPSPAHWQLAPDTLIVISCHWNDVRHRPDSQGLLLKVIFPAKQKPSPWINGHRRVCEHKEKLLENTQTSQPQSWAWLLNTSVFGEGDLCSVLGERHISASFLFLPGFPYTVLNFKKI